MKHAAQVGWGVVAAGFALAFTATVAPGSATALAVVAAGCAIVALVAATHLDLVDRPSSIATGVVLALFTASWALEQGGAHTGWALFVMHLCEVVAGCIGIGLLALLARRHHPGLHGVGGDAVIIGLGSWLIGWVAFVKPTLESTSEPVVSAMLDSLTLPIGSVLLFLAAVALVADLTRSAASYAIGAAAVAIVSSHLVVALADAGHVDADARRLAPALFIAAAMLLGGGLLLLARPAYERRTAIDPHRLLTQLIITTSSLVFPVIVLAASGPDDANDRVVRSIAALVLAGAVTVRIVITVRTNSDAQAELLRRAQTDPLTGLPNRVLMLERISSHVHENWRPDREPTLYFVDLDRFKNINDSLGHSAGDEVLRIVAERLVTAAPKEAMVARLSGDEYVVLDPTTASLASASTLAERLLAVFREPIALAQGDVFVTASIGVSSIDSMTAKPEDVLRHADTAMYRAKDAGRNTITFYDESMHQRIAHRLSVETALYRALDRQELRMFHQPILDIDTGDVVGFEALMRWQQGDGTIVSPAEFIPIAEETGTIVPIGAWALLESLSQLRHWIDDGVCSPSATMSVNVSPRQLADPSLPSIVGEALARSGVDASLLWVEITESVMISEPELALASLQKLKALGVRIALDDFGTGYSSLSLLQRFPLQRIKIDRAFVQGVADNPSDRALVRTIVAMGASLGLDMVAEGVESLHQMQVLHELGCRKAQGYLISHPVPADAMRSTVSALEQLGSFPLLRGDHRAGQI
jgi:diguanylate cyclase (GGDEF)-like protein